MLIRSPSTAALLPPLAELIGVVEARRLLESVGPPGVKHLGETELRRAAGLPSTLAKRVIAARRVFQTVWHSDEKPLRSSRDVLDALPEGLQYLEVEVVLAVALDTRMRPISTVLIAQGGASSAAFVPRDVFRPLLRLGARAFVLVHNHPSGSPTASEADIALTNTLAQFGRELDVPLLDHVIVGADGVCSFAELALLPTDDELSRPEVHRGVA